MAVWAALVVASAVSAPVPSRQFFIDCTTDYVSYNGSDYDSYCPVYVATASGHSYCCDARGADVVDNSPLVGLDCIAPSKFVDTCPMLITTQHGDRGAMCCMSRLVDFDRDDDWFNNN